MKTPASLVMAAAVLGACASAPDAPPSDQDRIEAWRPLIKGAKLHHVHLNVTDRQEAIAYYLKHVDGRAEKFAGTEDAIWVQRSWLLFNEVAERPPSSEGTGIHHIGWGTTDAAAIQTARAGVPSGCISIPCRYVHTNSETVDTGDVEACVALLTGLLANPATLPPL